MKFEIVFAFIAVFSIQALTAHDEKYNYAFKYTIERIQDLDSEGARCNLELVPEGLYKDDREKLLKLIDLMEFDIKTNTSYEAGRAKIYWPFILLAGNAHVIKKWGNQLSKQYPENLLIIASLTSIVVGTYFGFKLIDKLDAWNVKPRKMKELQKIKQIIDGVKINEN